MNSDKYKKAIDQIHASDELKNKTFMKIKEKPEKGKLVQFRKIVAIAAVIMIVFGYGILYINNKYFGKSQNYYQEQSQRIAENKDDKSTKDELPRFENMEQLRKALAKNEKKESIKSNSLLEPTVTSTETQKEGVNDVESEKDYSRTNTQVENVDEADIVKTDGKYIYYVQNSKVYIIKSDNLKILSQIEIKEDQKHFYPREIYINKEKLIVLGDGSDYEKYQTQTFNTSIITDTVSINSKNMAMAIVYDVSDKANPVMLREVGLEGNYGNSRMIGENIYFISNKYMYYNSQMKDYEILPIIRDTVSDEEEKHIECTDIAYFKGTENYDYMLVAGFNINNDEQANVETFFGASSIVYCSEKNLYIACTQYGDDYETYIYKFNLDNSKVVLQCKSEIKGVLDSQFSMDEYDDNLRVATTDGYDDEATNQLYVLDENLNQIGKIENLAKGEKIYSVRFIGKTGYVVTFKQIDPLFVIDLSNPEEPEVKGKLKIPGYSSYLHPYDETHIIGIGYNTKSNGYGGVVNDNMKMSMFDVSDLENPKEIFNVNIGKKYTNSEIIYNHKVLFYDKEKNLIGFPINYSSESKNGLIIFKIDLENGFEKYGEITQKSDYRTNIKRMIYIENILYTLSENKIVSYNLDTLEKITELQL